MNHTQEYFVKNRDLVERLYHFISMFSTLKIFSKSGSSEKLWKRTEMLGNILLMWIKAWCRDKRINERKSLVKKIHEVGLWLLLSKFVKVLTLFLIKLHIETSFKWYAQFVRSFLIDKLSFLDNSVIKIIKSESKIPMTVNFCGIFFGNDPYTTFLWHKLQQK